MLLVICTRPKRKPVAESGLDYMFPTHVYLPNLFNGSNFRQNSQKLIIVRRRELRLLKMVSTALATARLIDTREELKTLIKTD